jgi:hypothetical protein
VEESSELSGDESAELSADAHAATEPTGDEPATDAMATDAGEAVDAGEASRASSHDFIDPDELAGRVVTGESDVHASGADAADPHALEARGPEDADPRADGAPADHGEHAAGESDDADTSAHDDPPVD